MRRSPVVDLILQLACIETRASRHQFIEPEHLLEGLTKAGDICAADAMVALRAKGIDIRPLKEELMLIPRVIRDVGIDPTELRHQLRAQVGRGEYEHPRGATIHRSHRSRKLFARAAEIARRSGDQALGARHLFLAITEEKQSLGCKLLGEMGADFATIDGTTKSLNGGTPPASSRRRKTTG